MALEYSPWTKTSVDQYIALIVYQDRQYKIEQQQNLKSFVTPLI